MPVTRADIFSALRTVDDPEMPINIVDLGLIEEVQLKDDDSVSITLLPTFVGCPALPMIQELVTEAVGRVPGVEEVTVDFTFDPPWSVDRITEAGRASLREHGVTVPESGNRLKLADDPNRQTVQLRTSAIACPFCGSSQTHLDSPFGPTRCRMIYYCDACRNSFEHLKRV